ncbi:putative membrane protein [Sphingomonas jinjuensis]|uniref:Putative membrane protein n=1 Tax=Sphingomonas jinjuensis TaxID=535907 RepID=A0A840FB54_9SPHN|nr:DUF4126 family protein [Sphingomonas jinjuensis]MBB4153881.1 putative membrane protein [Sphingomonas jinjuensis]
MLRSILIAATAGARALTPLAAVANAARARQLPADSGIPPLLANPLIATGILAIAGGEMAGDKMKSAPDRIIAPGLVGRTLTGAVAAMAFAPKDRRVTAAALGAATAIVSSFVTFRARQWAMRRWGQTATGAVEDAIVLGIATLAVRAPLPAAR